MACACRPRRSYGNSASCSLRYSYVGGSLTRTSERNPSREVDREEALHLVDEGYQLRELEAKACRGQRASYPVSWGGKLVVTKRRG